MFDENGKAKVLKDKEENKKEKGFNTRSYINLLRNKVIPSIKTKYNKNLSNLIYIQDNSKVHTGKNDGDLTCKQLLSENDIELEENYPPYSPDLNPVENVWAMINKEKNKILDKIKFEEYPKNKKEGLILIRKAYENVSNDSVVNCYNSFKNRMKLVLLNNGNNLFDYSTKRSENKLTLIDLQ